MKRLPGTTNVQIFGAKDYAMRIWVRPDRLAQLKLTTSDVVRAINEQNAQFAAGKVGQAPYGGNQELVYTVTIARSSRRPEGVREHHHPLRQRGGSRCDLKDVARVELGSKDYDFIGRYNGKRATLVGVFLQPGANALAVARHRQGTSRRTGEALSRRAVVRHAVRHHALRRGVDPRGREVTLSTRCVLVFLVVFLFLQNWRATLIPIIAVPVSLIGTFAGLLMLGYSINTLTLFGMVLAIGIVVDDAIVVLENVERIMHEEKLNAREAAIVAMEEVTSPIVAIVLVLVSVFVPIAFLGGLTGELYRQFSITISIAVAISGVVALTLTPSLCVMMLKREHKNPARFFAGFNHWFTNVTRRYTSGVIWMIRRGAIALLLFGLMVLIAVGLWRFTPGSLVPDEDQGFFISAVILPDGASLQRTDKVVNEVVEILKSNPNNQDVVAFTGFDFLGGGFRNNAATIFVTQMPWDKRKGVATPQLVGEFFMKTGHIKEGLVLAFAPPAIFGLGTAGGYELYIQNHGEGGPAKTQQALQRLLGRLNSDPMLGGAQTLWRANVPQLYVDVDRDKAKALGVPINDVFDTLSATLGSFYVNDFNKYGRTWQVLMSAEPQYRNRPETVGDMWVRSARGEMVPLSSLATVKYASGPDSLDRFNNLPAVKIFGQAAPGVSSGQAIARVEQIAREVLPDDFSFDWGGVSFQEKRSAGTSGLALGMAVVMVFLILPRSTKSGRCRFRC